jgi:hypothetical protein
MIARPSEIAVGTEKPKSWGKVMLHEPLVNPDMARLDSLPVTAYRFNVVYGQELLFGLSAAFTLVPIVIQDEFAAEIMRCGCLLLEPLIGRHACPVSRFRVISGAPLADMKTAAEPNSELFNRLFGAALDALPYGACRVDLRVLLSPALPALLNAGLARMRSTTRIIRVP